MIFSLCYTSVRPEFIPQVIQLWRKKAAHPENVEVIVAVDEGDTASFQAATEAKAECVLVQTERPFSCVKGWNLAAQSTKGSVLIAIADDFVPPDSWDEQLLGVSDKGWIFEDRVVKVWDGYNPDLCTLSILTRARYNRFGYMFYPGYLSMFNDTEFTSHAYQDKVVIEAMNLLFEHKHPDCGKRPRDNHDLSHASNLRWQLGESLFKYRRAQKFPLDMGPRSDAYTRPIFQLELDDFAVYVQAVRDDFCLFDTCYRMATSGIRHFYLFVPSHYWDGNPVKESDSKQVDLVAKMLCDLGCKANSVHLPVNFEGHANRLSVETEFRNQSLTYMWDHGVNHVIVVDGDEIWYSKFMEAVAPCVKEHAALQCPMIPVIGLPGYPVDQASDNAVIYVRKGNLFKVCRTPTQSATTIPIRGVIHFTATRKTTEEIVAKMRGGGHYDDPDYDFEGWVQRKLPNIKPGMRDAHMYKPYQIWPLVRAWTMKEIEEIPPSIRPFLGLPTEAVQAPRPNIVEMAKFLNRPPCQEPTHRNYRVGVFVAARR